MNQCYCKVNNLQTDIYTDYFLNEFIPKNAVTANTTLTTFNQNLINDEMINRLGKELQLNYKFYYPIQSFFIFYHNANQRIHIDGSQTIYQSSLNLPLVGSENTKMIFYNELEYYDWEIGTAHYIYNDLTVKETLYHSNEWVFINPSIPHHIVGPTIENPRITLCIRFSGNPKFNKCKNYFI